jgi:hypothetical protein
VAEYPLENIRFAHNTFVNCGDIDLGGTGPNKVSFENNIFQKNTGNIFSNANLGTTWSGNVVYGNSGIVISNGITQADPKLVLNPAGYYELSASSTAINAASTIISPMLDIPGLDDDPGILLDFTGQTRPQTELMKDIGCDEYTTGTVTNKPLILSDVGPVYLRGTPTSLNREIREDFDDLIIFPNPASRDIQVRFTPESKSLAYLSILNCEGRLVRHCPLGEIRPEGFFSRKFDISSLENGVYQVVLLGEKWKRNKKLIIQN